LSSFRVPLEEEQRVSQTGHSTTPTKVVPLLRRSTKLVIRWNSDKQQYTAQRPLLPVTQRITISRTFGNLNKIDNETDVFNSEICVAFDTNAFLDQMVERTEPRAHTGKLGATVVRSSKFSSTKLTGVNQTLFNSTRLSPFIYIWLGGE
jgi:hypothetical protein